MRSFSGIVPAQHVISCIGNTLNLDNISKSSWSYAELDRYTVT